MLAKQQSLANSHACNFAPGSSVLMPVYLSASYEFHEMCKSFSTVAYNKAVATPSFVFGFGSHVIKQLLLLLLFLELLTFFDFNL